ncbi:hypothetical protein BDF19DRAFT_454447 [Syncephalis fuscata]|nr:hypothetical protein BDF19DRAFT_454447 [Syncephalis fuscata]
MPDGLRNRPRGRGFSRGRGQYSRAMPRGRGYPRSMASYPSRPRNSNVNNDDDNKRTVTAVTKEVNTPPVREQSNKVSAVPPTTTKESVKANPTPIKSNESESATKETDTAAPHTKAVSNNYSGNAGRQWGHDGFEELVRTEQQRERVTPTGYRGNSTGLYRATGRGRPFRGRGRGRGRGVSLHDNSSFGGFRGEGMEGRDHYVATLKPDQKTYKPRPAVETGTTTFNKQKADTTLSKDKTAVDVTETPSAPLPPSSSKGRQIRFGNIVNVTLSGTPSAATNNNSAAKFSTHPAVTPSQPKPKEKAVTNVAVVEEQAAVKEMATQTSTVTTIAANSPIAQPLGPTAETVANAGMAAAAANAAANAVQSTVTATKSTMTSMVNSAASTAAPTSAASTTSTGTNTTATATTTAPTTSPVVYLYTTANGLTIPITDGNPYQMMTSHGPPAIHPHHHHPHHPHHHQHPSQTHPHHAHHHRASSQVSVSHQPILVQTASGLVVPVTPVNATSGAGGTGAGAGSGATNTTGGNSSAGGYYGRPVVSQYSVPYSTGVDPNHPSPQSMPPTYIPYPGAMPLFMPPNSGGAPTGNAIYYNPMPYSPTAPAAVTTNSGNNANNSRKSYTDEDHIGEDPTVTMPSYYYHPGHGMHAPTSAAPATITMTASALSSSVSIPQQQRRTSASMSSMPSGVRISPSSSSSNQQ